MAIVLDLSPSGAINSYNALIAEMRDLQDNAAYDVAAIDRAIRKAEAFFLRRLRLPEMEVVTTLAATLGIITLPTDCREVRSVIWLGTGAEYPLAQMSLSALSDTFQGYTGTPSVYAQEGTTLRLGMTGNGNVRLTYFADLTPLGEFYPTNWLLTKAPDLYVAGTQYYLCRRERDDKGAADAMAEMNGILQSLFDEDNRYGGGNLIPQGVRQVCGSRV